MSPEDAAKDFSLQPDNFSQKLLAHILPNAAKPRPEPRHTALGTPCARAWDDPWIALVEAAEQRLEHRICGARDASGNPCELPANHENGRCKFHGGFALTGAPQGNRNAVVHGLYSRRLKTCGEHCPLWGKCPCSGPEVRAIKPPNRPTCPYEQAEYNAALTDALDRAAGAAKDDPISLHVAHNVALLQVMFSRAALSLRDAPLTDRVTTYRNTTEEGAGSESHYSKPSSLVHALTRLGNEHRRYIALLGPIGDGQLSANAHLDRTVRGIADTALESGCPDMLEHGSNSDLDITQHHLRESIEHALAGDDTAACAAFATACDITRRVKKHIRDVNFVYNTSETISPSQAVVQALHYLVTGSAALNPRIAHT